MKKVAALVRHLPENFPLFFGWKCMKCMLQYTIRKYQSFYQNSFIKVKVDWKNSRRSQGVLGLTSWVCMKAPRVYLAIHYRIPAGAPTGAGSYWKHCLGCQSENPKENNWAFKLQTSHTTQLEKTLKST